MTLAGRIAGMHSTIPPCVLSLAAMAARLHIPSRALRAAAEAGDVPCVHVGDAMLFAPEAVERSLAKRATETCQQERWRG